MIFMGNGAELVIETGQFAINLVLFAEKNRTKKNAALVGGV